MCHVFVICGIFTSWFLQSRHLCLGRRSVVDYVVRVKSWIVFSYWDMVVNPSESLFTHDFCTTPGIGEIMVSRDVEWSILPPDMTRMNIP